MVLSPKTKKILGSTQLWKISHKAADCWESGTRTPGKVSESATETFVTSRQWFYRMDHHNMAVQAPLYIFLMI